MIKLCVRLRQSGQRKGVQQIFNCPALNDGHVAVVGVSGDVVDDANHLLLEKIDSRIYF